MTDFLLPSAATATTDGLCAGIEDAEAGAAGPLTVLHVEDSPPDAILAQEQLRSVQPGTRFDTAVRLSDLSAERAAAADCALLDLSLPDASGLEALVALRAMAEDLPIIVVSGFDDLDLALSALGFGADDYLVKNHLDGDTLRRAIRYAIERRRLRAQLAQEAAASTVAEAMVIAAEAALDAELARRSRLGEERSNHAPDGSGVLLGTHEVAVRVDDTTGDYTLRCRSCAWVGARGPDKLHSWAERSLDVALLDHVDFGDMTRTPVTADASAPSKVRLPPAARPRA